MEKKKLSFMMDVDGKSNRYYIIVKGVDTVNEAGDRLYNYMVNNSFIKVNGYSSEEPLIINTNHVSSVYGFKLN